MFYLIYFLRKLLWAAFALKSPLLEVVDDIVPSKPVPGSVILVAVYRWAVVQAIPLLDLALELAGDLHSLAAAFLRRLDSF